MSCKFAIIIGFLLLPTCVAQAASSRPQDYDHFQPTHHPQFNVIQQENISSYGNPSYYNVKGKRYHVLESAIGYDKEGIASWYGDAFHGELTSNRERYDMYAMTAASKDLPLPTYVRVTNLENGRQIVVRVNDRGPFHGDRLIDLSYAAAKVLGFTENGTARVRITAITSPMTTRVDGERAQHYIQMAAFHNENNAAKFRDTLSDMTTFPIRIKFDRKDMETLYRVQVGPFDRSDRLESEQHHLKILGFSHTLAVLN